MTPAQPGPDEIRRILEEVRSGDRSVDQALADLRWAPFEDLGFARVDLHRRLRKGVPEVVYAAGKTPAQVAEIAGRLLSAHGAVLCTRVDGEQASLLQERFPQAVHHEPARIVEIRAEPRTRPAPDTAVVAVISAGTSDQPVAEEAAVTAEALGSRVERIFDCGVAGIHRLLAARETLDRARVFVVVAGMEGALPSVVGGLVDRPVIAVPTSVGYGASFHGLAALLGMLNTCASGVAVVNIDNGFGAGYFAHLLTRDR